MKNKKWIIALIVGLSIITLILIGVFIVLLTNGNVLKKYFRFEIKTSTKTILDQTYSSNNLEITTNNSDIEFKYSDDNNIRVIVYGEDKKDINVKEDVEKINIDFTDDTKHFFGINLISNKIEVYVPRTYDKDININSNLGDINAINLEQSNVNIDIDCGDVELDAVKSVIVESNLGDVSINKVTEYLDIKSDCGDVDLENVNLIKDSKIKSDLGDVEIDRINDVYINAKADVGEIDVKRSNRYSDITLTIESDVGEISVN